MKRLLGVFFLTNFLFATGALAQTNPTLTVGSDTKATEILHAQNLGSAFTFDFEGNFIFAKPVGSAWQIVKLSPTGESTVLVERVSQPVWGLSFHKGLVYVVFPGRIDVVNKGSLSDIVTGLPASGDYGNSAIIFGEDGKMYFSVGTATNSGLVGQDNAWLKKNPSVHDLICPGFKINQINIETDNFLTAKKDDKASTGAFMPFNTQAYTDTPPGSIKCNGVIMRANPDGSNLEIVATGFHNPKGISFDAKGSLFALDSAMENRGVRPVADGKDALYAVSSGNWYGWPDYNAGKKLDNPIIKDAKSDPVQPVATFDPGHLSQFLVSEFGANSGLAISDQQKIVLINFGSGKFEDFATLVSGSKIEQMKFGPDGNLYVLVSNGKNSELWKIESTRHPVVTAGSTDRSRTLSTAWSISLSVTFLGFIGTYLVYKNRQEPIT